MSNKDNLITGKHFQQIVLALVSDRFNQPFEEEVAFYIGNPPKEHKFDCVSDDRKIVVECKCHTWTSVGNSPSAKMAILNEAEYKHVNITSNAHCHPEERATKDLGAP
jgi:hypothetical protein